MAARSSISRWTALATSTGCELGLERPREGTLDHALEPALEALQNSHRGTSFPVLASDRIGGMGPLADVLT